jgi:hypothetical protein
MKTMRKKSNNKKKVLFSYESAVKLAVVLLIFVFVHTVITYDEDVQVNGDLENDAIEVLNTITDEDMPISVLESNELVVEKMEQLHRIGYTDIKSLVGIKNDFCIFFEDVTGNIVAINGFKNGLGSSKIQVNGKPCQ